jgi:hypothetical protein
LPVNAPVNPCSAGLLLLMKTFQRLGYFAAYADIPAPIVRHILRCAALVCFGDLCVFYQNPYRPPIWLLSLKVETAGNARFIRERPARLETAQTGY